MWPLSAVITGPCARHVKTLRTLVEAGANVKIADRDGKTPLSLARLRGYGEMVSILEEAVR
jgi:ankyrin repeat protein